jgi:hypothetical protein
MRVSRPRVDNLLHHLLGPLTSTRSESDFAELVAVTPALGFVSKNELSADVVHDFVADRCHGGGCRHEALIYSSDDELVAGTVPFIRQGIRRIVADAQRTHPILRSARGSRASARYTPPRASVRALEHEVPELLQRP